MAIAVDPDASVPPYEQIRAQVAAGARDGTLPAGTRLPTVRELADELGVAPGTVARAYRALETDRVVETRGRHGTFVSAGADAVTREAFALATEFVARVRRMGLSRADALAHVSAAFTAAASDRPDPTPPPG